AGLRPAADLDLAPGEVDSLPDRLPDRLLRREAPGVVLRRVRLRVAVRALRLGEAALAEPVPVALERTPDARDLDEVDADPDRGQRSPASQSGRWAIEETMPSGRTLVRSSSSGRNLPVRTSTVRIPTDCAPAMSCSKSSPTIQVISGSESIASRAALKYAG